MAVVKERLDALTGDGAAVLYHRRMRGTVATIDHLVVASSGVWVIQTSRVAGLVAKLAVRRRWSRYGASLH